jgi:hypothetical protein
MSWRKINLKKVFIALLIIQATVNLIGALGPELGFDALWYHLTEAKLFLQQRSIAPISGNLLYWSGLPRLGEMIYAAAIALWDERLAKLIHWLAGIASAWLVYKIGRRRYKPEAALAASLLFYTTLLVGWLSTSAYIDLIFTAFFLAAVLARSWWAKALGLILAGATKLQAIPYNAAVTLMPWSLLGALPFWLVNWRTTGNFFYPFGENFGIEGEWWYNGFWFWFSRPLRLFFDPSFRIGPVILLLLVIFHRKINWSYLLRPTVILFFFWWLGPGTGFGRFALPLLALASIMAASIFSHKRISRLALILLVFQVAVGISGRFWANQKYLPLIFGHQTKAEFLSQYLKFDFGDFYDVDGYFKQNIGPQDKVLIYNIHNLYYVEFPFDHQSWADGNTRYSHILVGNNLSLPGKYSRLPLIYQNPKTQVKLFKIQ